MTPSAPSTDPATHEELCDLDMDEVFSDEEEIHNKLANVQIQTPTRDLAIRPVYQQSLDRDLDPVFLLRMFYQRFFPYKHYFLWLNYDNAPTNNFVNREFSFTLQSDIYIRYNSFADVDSLRKEIERLQPIKIDIGAVYAVQPKLKKTVSEKAFRPLEKELVFDIDMTDYDEVRTCCTGGDICHKCWEFMTIAIKVIDASLREDFGFKHLLWVYSGRRGVHCWVCDERARRLDNEARKAIVSFLEVIKGGANQERKVKLPAILHPSLSRSLEIIKPYFSPLILEKQAVLDTPESWNKMLSIIPDADVRESVNSKWSASESRSGTQKWDILRSELRKAEDKKKPKDNLARDLVFQYCYPRLDDKVSTNINHLLKSPFCVHPKTQRVCVPIKPETCETFDPLAVPTLSTLSGELNAYSAAESERKVPDYKKTSLRPYIETFEKFVNGLLLEVQRDKREESLHSMEF